MFLPATLSHIQQQHVDIQQQTILYPMWKSLQPSAVTYNIILTCKANLYVHVYIYIYIYLSLSLSTAWD